MAKAIDGKSFITGGLAGLLLAVFVGAAEDTEAKPAPREEAAVGRYDIAASAAGFVVVDTVTGRVWQNDPSVKSDPGQKERR